MEGIALAQVILAMLPTITTGAEHLFQFVDRVRTAAQQSEEWTPEMEAAFQRELLRKARAPESLTDSALAGSAPAVG